MRLIILCAFVAWLTGCRQQSVVTIERLNDGLDTVLTPGASIEILADSFLWSEGPLWLESRQALLFSDVPRNTIYQWTRGGGVSQYLTPSGYTLPEDGSGAEGSNGLLLSPEGKLVLCQHGDRRMAVMDADLDRPAPVFTTLADAFYGKRFNSPNDAVYRTTGGLYFTDPPYGFVNDDNDSLKQLPFNGVYLLASKNTPTLLIDSLTRPNGIALLNNEQTLLVANSDPQKSRWYAYDIHGVDSLVNGRVFFDATRYAQSEPGLPDGLKVNRKGIIFATGPGGVWIFTPAGEVLGRIRITVPAANCAFGNNEKELFITADNYLIRVSLL